MDPVEATRKRLYMRSIRRGIKEMDLILTAYADRNLATMTEADLALYDQFLSEFDHDIYGWVTGQDTAPEVYAPIMAEIAQIAEGLTKPA